MCSITEVIWQRSQDMLALKWSHISIPQDACPGLRVTCPSLGLTGKAQSGLKAPIIVLTIPTLNSGHLDAQMPLWASVHNIYSSIPAT